MKNKGFTLAELMVAMGISTAVIGLTLVFIYYQSRYSSETVFTMKAQKLIYNVLMDMRFELMKAGPYSNGGIRITTGGDGSKLEIDSKDPKDQSQIITTTYEWKKSTSTLYKNGNVVLGPEVAVQIEGKPVVMQPIVGKTFKVEGFTVEQPEGANTSLYNIELDYSWMIRNVVDKPPPDKRPRISVNIPDYQITDITIINKAGLPITGGPIKRLLLGGD